MRLAGVALLLYVLSAVAARPWPPTNAPSPYLPLPCRLRSATLKWSACCAVRWKEHPRHAHAAPHSRLSRSALALMHLIVITLDIANPPYRFKSSLLLAASIVGHNRGGAELDGDAHCLLHTAPPTNAIPFTPRSVQAFCRQDSANLRKLVWSGGVGALLGVLQAGVCLWDVGRAMLEVMAARLGVLCCKRVFMCGWEGAAAERAAFEALYGA